MHNRVTQARPYARAAFEQARAEGALASWTAFLQVLAQLAADPQVVRLLPDPRIGRDRILQLLCGVCGARLEHKSQANFIELLLDAGRLTCAPEMYDLFRERKARLDQVSQVQVVTAYELQPAEQERISKLLVQYFDSRVELTMAVDAELIGGVRIRLGDTVIDASVRGRLNRFADALAAT